MMMISPTNRFATPAANNSNPFRANASTHQRNENTQHNPFGQINALTSFMHRVDATRDAQAASLFGAVQGPGRLNVFA